MDTDRKLRGIAIATTGLMLLFGLLGNGPSTYRFAILFLGPMLWAVYYFRRPLALEPVGFGLFAFAMLLHDLGAFGFYRRDFAGIEFDFYVHFYFGFAGAYLLANTFAAKMRWEGAALWVGTTLAILGIGAIHELVEYATTLALGPEKGMLKINDPDKFDTQKDLLNNLMGTLLALAVRQFFSRRRPGELQRPSSELY